ncbi:MAG TPA: FAD-binding oxidoreductase [Anaeromyxobacter sp.]|nr:FAD-binding oxidoreductase [Anaeromyxobacter sp.]
MSAVPAAARAVEPRDAVLGVAPRLAVEPASVEEAADAMRAFARDRLAVVFVGGGTDMELGAAPARLDAVLRTTGLARIREHAPSDQIVAVQGGMRLADLQRHLAGHHQRLALDPPFPDRATVGGIVAANAFGPRRTRYGPVRDLVIGITIVRADGAVAHGGGKVVKNVAGFDLPRLFCGSLGTLGLVAEVVFRLHPLPEASGTAVFEGLDARDVAETLPVLRDLGVEPTAVAALPSGGKFALAVRFEGFAPGVKAQVERTLARAGAGAKVEGGDEAALWSRHDAVRCAGDVRAKATFAPASLARAADALAPVAGALRGGAIVLHPGPGIAFVSGSLDGADRAAAAIESARSALAPLAGGALVLSAAPAELRARTSPWGPPPQSLEVMRRLKKELDPEARLAPGRFVGGI